MTQTHAEYLSDYQLMRSAAVNLEGALVDRLVKACQQNDWLKVGGIDFEPDGFCPETDYPYGLERYDDVDMLKRLFAHGNWAIRAAVQLHDLIFVNPGNGGDEWCTLKIGGDALVPFESITCRLKRPCMILGRRICARQRLTRLARMLAIPKTPKQARRGRPKPAVSPAAEHQCCLAHLLRAAKPPTTPTPPRDSKITPLGSGTASPLRVNAVLKAVPPTISAPTRSQSGSRAELRTHSWRSVNPGGNEVPGGTIGLGAESQKNSPPVTATVGTKK